VEEMSENNCPEHPEKKNLYCRKCVDNLKENAKDRQREEIEESVKEKFEDFQKHDWGLPSKADEEEYRFNLKDVRSILEKVEKDLIDEVIKDGG
jgi:hypothetical protein